MSDNKRLTEKANRKKELLESLSAVKGRLFDDDKSKIFKSNNAKNDVEIRPRYTSVFNLIFGIVIGILIACIYLVIYGPNRNINKIESNNI